VRKIGTLLILLITLSSCGFPNQEQETIDPCIEIKKTAQNIAKNFPNLNEVDKTRAKLELLRWAFMVTGDPQCFDGETVATAKSAIALVGSNSN
jgi:hypothetical protein